MTADEARVADLIREGFRSVQLGNGIGLWQAQGIDDYDDPQTIAEYRSRDEKTDWSRIPFADLNYCYSSLSFFDAEGMRFHLPAYLIADLEGMFNRDIIFHLTSVMDYGDSQFSMLSAAQHTAVREFLLIRLTQADDEFHRPMIEEALNDTWAAREEFS